MKIARRSAHLPGDRPWVGVNFWSRLGGPFMWRTYDDVLVRAELATLAAHQMTVTRSFLFWPDFHPAPDTVDDVFVDRYRRFLRAHEDIGMRTVPTFLVGHMSGQNFDVPWRGGRDLYRDSFMLGQQAFYIREITRRLADSPAIAGWLISNEIPLLAGAADRHVVRAWALICTNAVRAGGSVAPVSLGDGGWGQDTTGLDNGFRLSDQHDIVDFIGPHVYPVGTDQVRQFFAAAIACQLSAAGSSAMTKPVILEEFGVSSAFASDVNAAHYYRQVLHLSVLAGASGWLAWNNTDFDLADQIPYRHHLHELRFGLTTATGQPKPALAEYQRFADLLGRIDLRSCRRADTSTAIVIPSYLSGSHPFVDEADRRAIPPVLTQSYIAASRAGLAPAVVREEDGLPRAALILIPATKALIGPTFAELSRRAEQGAHIYLSYFAGPGRSAGAWWPSLEPLFGVRHRLRYGLADQAGAETILTVRTPFGTLTCDHQLNIHPAGPSTAYLPLEVVDDADVEVLLTDQRGQPALLRRAIGGGALYLSAYPIEYYASQRPDANADDPTPLLYAALAAEAGASPDIGSSNPHVITDSLIKDDGDRFVWLINCSETSQPALLVTPDDTTLRDLLTGEPVNAATVLDPFGVMVARCEVGSGG